MEIYKCFLNCPNRWICSNDCPIGMMMITLICFTTPRHGRTLRPSSVFWSDEFLRVWQQKMADPPPPPPSSLPLSFPSIHSASQLPVAALASSDATFLLQHLKTCTPSPGRLFQVYEAAAGSKKNQAASVLGIFPVRLARNVSSHWQIIARLHDSRRCQRLGCLV